MERLRRSLDDAPIIDKDGYEYAVIYDGPGEADAVYEGEPRGHVDGWVELANGDLLSPASANRIGDRTLPETP